jgi:hypothetical protein
MRIKGVKILIILFLSKGVLGQTQNISGVAEGDLTLNTITTALPFLSITPDSRAGAMGEAGTALSANSNSVYWNTSMLSFAEKKAEISVSYTPWLRQLTNDINLSYLSGYYKVNDKHSVGGSLRYFSLGEITFTDANGQVIRNDKPSEYEIVGAYAFKLSNKLSVGLNGKFAYSNLTGGLIVGGVNTKPAIAGASDISFTYYNDQAKLGRADGAFTFATTLNNIGNKIAYSENAKRDFIPMGLKIASSYKVNFDKYNNVLWAVELQKLLVPTPPTYAIVDGARTSDIASGKNNDIGVVAGIMQSFYDAPGVVKEDAQGNHVQNADGSYEVYKGSRLKEELTEINIATGMEYWYNDVFALRTGFFYENKNKGNRRYVDFGAGFKYNNLGIDMSYLVSVSGKNSPLANTLRFTLRYTIGNEGGNKKSSL